MLVLGILGTTSLFCIGMYGGQEVAKVVIKVTGKLFAQGNEGICEEVCREAPQLRLRRGFSQRVAPPPHTVH